MNEFNRAKSGSVHLSDGEVVLAILNANNPREPGHLPGLYHFGFHVGDPDLVAQRIKEMHPECAPEARPSGTAYVEPRGSDPGGNLFDISTWVGVKNRCQRKKAGRVPQSQIPWRIVLRKLKDDR